MEVIDGWRYFGDLQRESSSTSPGSQGHRVDELVEIIEDVA